jgi:alpha-mannosidase
VQEDGISARLFPFGWGDGGGGPTRDHLEYLRRQANLEGVPRVRMASPLDYFGDLQEKGVPEAGYVGELYYQNHRGTYTSQARTKRGNRKCECALREAEMWGATASVLTGFGYPADEMDAAWKAVFVNQFHDVLPGSSIRRVYEEAEATYAAVLDRVVGVARDGARALAGGGTGRAAVFNSLCWERRELVELPDGFSGAASECGEALPTQKINGKLFAEAKVPSCGWTSLASAEPCPPGSGATATARSLENELLRVEFNGQGEIASLFDKEAGRELTAEPCNVLRMYKDVPTRCDAWDIESMYPLAPVELPGEAAFDVVAGGPLAAVARIHRQLGESSLVQEVWMRRGSRRVEFRTVVDWQESHKLLKVAFPVHVHATEAVHEIQFGHVRRPTHKSRPFDADRFEVCNQKWTALAEEGRGVAILNDCKYGVNVDRNSINLTLLRAPLAPDMHADKGRQEFTYALYAWNGSLAGSNVVREAYELNCPALVVPGGGGDRSLFAVGAPNVVMEAVKPAEDGSGDIVVRLYEAMRTATRCVLTTSLPVASASLTNMLEEPEAELEVADGRIALEFRPFEIKTLRLSF